MINQSIGTEKTWTEDGITYRELICQHYTNCAFSAGEVEGHEVDTMYLRMVRDDGTDDVFVMLREDEAAAICWVLTGVLFGRLVVRE